MSKKQNIITDLLNGLEVNMLSNIKRYGTSARTRISEFRADGYKIESRVIHESGALAYYMTKEAIKARDK